MWFSQEADAAAADAVLTQRDEEWRRRTEEVCQRYLGIVTMTGVDVGFLTLFQANEAVDANQALSDAIITGAKVPSDVLVSMLVCARHALYFEGRRGSQVSVNFSQTLRPY